MIDKNKINIPVSVGELADKITILEIKKDKINNKLDLKEINKELKLLKQIWKKKKLLSLKVKIEFKRLKKINLRLWSIEDKKRKHERDKIFDKKFINLARNVYILNDKRASIKKNINKLTGSDINEVKSYKKY
tara:strand:+ start:54 stop:452 length:399 start_codon:yes stop_codon:yes gene_type:complete